MAGESPAHHVTSIPSEGAATPSNRAHTSLLENNIDPKTLSIEELGKRIADIICSCCDSDIDQNALTQARNADRWQPIKKFFANQNLFFRVVSTSFRFYLVHAVLEKLSTAHFFNKDTWPETAYLIDLLS